MNTNFKRNLLYLSILTLTNPALSQNHAAHQHQAAVGAMLLMSGDDHFEISYQSKSQYYQIRLSDKFRNPLSLTDFETLTLTLKFADASQTLSLSQVNDKPDVVQFKLPLNIHQKWMLILDKKRKDPPKDYISARDPLTIELKTLLKLAKK